MTKEFVPTNKNTKAFANRESAPLAPAIVETTVHVGKLTHNIAFKKRAPRAMREIRAYVARVMKTEDVRISPTLNKALWAKGVRNLPNRIRIQMARQADEENDSFFTTVEHIEVESFDGLQTTVQQ